MAEVRMYIQVFYYECNELKNLSYLIMLSNYCDLYTHSLLFSLVYICIDLSIWFSTYMYIWISHETKSKCDVV